MKNKNHVAINVTTRFLYFNCLLVTALFFHVWICAQHGCSKTFCFVA